MIDENVRAERGADAVGDQPKAPTRVFVWVMGLLAACSGTRSSPKVSPTDTPSSPAPSASDALLQTAPSSDASGVSDVVNVRYLGDSAAKPPMRNIHAETTVETSAKWLILPFYADDRLPQTLHPEVIVTSDISGVDGFETEPRTTLEHWFRLVPIPASGKLHWDDLTIEFRERRNGSSGEIYLADAIVASDGSDWVAQIRQAPYSDSAAGLEWTAPSGFSLRFLGLRTFTVTYPAR